MYAIGHFINMVFLSIINFLSSRENSKVGKICSNLETTIIYGFMVNPFTFSFFGPVLDYFICPDLSSQAHSISLYYSLAFIFLLGPSLMALCIYLDEKSFKDLFKGKFKGSTDEEHPFVEIVDSDNISLSRENMNQENEVVLKVV
jgi:hypothetical protein